MRKNSKKNIQVEIARVQAYHQDGGCQSYAFRGFKSNKYFTSDRYIMLDEHFRQPNGQPLEGYGLEIETECFSVKETTIVADVFLKIIFVLFPADLFKMQEDGSLGHWSYHNNSDSSCVGIECITQVMKKSFIRNNYPAFKAMYNSYFPAFKISCAESGRCGMHVNISNACFGKTEEKQLEAIRKLHYIINKDDERFQFACKLFKRDYNNTGYCGRIHYNGVNPEELDLEYDCPNDHYHCLNYDHFEVGRIELRLVGGQPDFWAFRNTMETVFFLVDRVKKIAWKDCDDIAKIFKGCNQYVYKRLMDCDLDSATLTKIQTSVVEEDLDIHN